MFKKTWGLVSPRYLVICSAIAICKACWLQCEGYEELNEAIENHKKTNSD